MKHIFFLMLVIASLPLQATTQQQLQTEIEQLQRQTEILQGQIKRLHREIATTPSKHGIKTSKKHASSIYHDSPLTVHSYDANADTPNFYPTALMVNERIVTYIAGTPVVSSPYLGDRPAFDGSDYIVNISSINRDLRLMQQRRKLYNAYQSMGYPVPNFPIIFLSGKAEPMAELNRRAKRSTGDLTLGSSELDVAAILNENVEAFMSIAYDESPPAVGGPRVDNSAFNLNMGFINIGNLEKSPLYFTAGQLYVPFGRYSSAMISAPLTMIMARTKSRPFIFGYKSQSDNGPFAAVYGFRGETTLGKSGVGGVNLGYNFGNNRLSGEIGGGYISALNDAAGMQNTGVAPFTTFGGFASVTNGNEMVQKTPGANAHVNVSFDRYNLNAEWVGAAESFRVQDLSYNGHAAKPQAAQIEGGVTFKAVDKPASVGLGYQRSREALALGLPEQRISAVFNISIWKDTVETLEYRHDMFYKTTEYANGTAPTGSVNATTYGLGGSSDALLAQIGVYF